MPIPNNRTELHDTKMREQTSYERDARAPFVYPFPEMIGMAADIIEMASQHLFASYLRIAHSRGRLGDTRKIYFLGLNPFMMVNGKPHPTCYYMSTGLDPMWVRCRTSEVEPRGFLHVAL